jgi:hypothetical protein
VRRGVHELDLHVTSIGVGGGRQLLWIAVDIDWSIVKRDVKL